MSGAIRWLFAVASKVTCAEDESSTLVRRKMRRSVSIASSAFVLMGLLQPLAANGQSAANRGVPTCFGKKATIVGSSRANRLVGTRRADVIVGLGGNDVIVGKGGRDLVCGGAGNDRLSGGSGNDRIDGGLGNDEIDAGPGNDSATGKSGNDTIAGGTGSDRLSGAGGNDVVYAGSTKNLLGSLGTILHGGAGSDILIGGAGADTLQGASGIDALVGLTGNDRYEGGDGIDIAGFLASQAGVTVDLAAGTAGGEGSDTLAGIEAVMGSPFNDILLGDAGPNFFWGLPGNDLIDGRAGSNYVLFTSASAGVFANLTDGTVTGEGNDTLVSIENLVGSNHNDTLIGTSAWNYLDGAGGTDTVDGRGGGDMCFGETLLNCPPNLGSTNDAPSPPSVSLRIQAVGDKTADVPNMGAIPSSPPSLPPEPVSSGAQGGPDAPRAAAASSPGYVFCHPFYNSAQIKWPTDYVGWGLLYFRYNVGSWSTPSHWTYFDGGSWWIYENGWIRVGDESSGVRNLSLGGGTTVEAHYYKYGLGFQPLGACKVHASSMLGYGFQMVYGG